MWSNYLPIFRHLAVWEEEWVTDRRTDKGRHAVFPRSLYKNSNLFLTSLGRVKISIFKLMAPSFHVVQLNASRISFGHNLHFKVWIYNSLYYQGPFGAFIQSFLSFSFLLLLRIIGWMSRFFGNEGKKSWSFCPFSNFYVYSQTLVLVWIAC